MRHTGTKPRKNQEKRPRLIQTSLAPGSADRLWQPGRSGVCTVPRGGTLKPHGRKRIRKTQANARRSHLVELRVLPGRPANGEIKTILGLTLLFDQILLKKPCPLTPLAEAQMYLAG